MSNIISDVEGIAGVITSVVGAVETAIKDISSGTIDEFFSIATGKSDKASSYIAHVLSKELGNFDRDLGRLVVQPLLEGTMGINYDTLKSQSFGAVQTLEGAVGFSLMLDTVTEALDAILKPLLGDRAPEFILETIHKIPQAVGMEYFLGITLANTFELAVGEPLQEAINEQVLPSRVDIEIIRQGLRQHRITEEEADSYRKKLGYPEDQWKLIKDLGRNVLAIGDLAKAYEFGFIDDTKLEVYLEHQGYSETDIALLKNLYIKTSETTGGAVYRQVARSAYLENYLSTKQFTTILEKANVPPNSITLELEALDLQKAMGVKRLSAADIKAAYDSGDISPEETKTRLLDLGYPPDDVDIILHNWQVGPYVIKPTTSAKTIVRYYRSGIIDEETTSNALARLGFGPDQIATILANPEQLGSAFTHTNTESSIISAYKDGLIDVDKARGELEALGIAPSTITQELLIAQYAIAHKRPTKSSTKTLDKADIHDAYKNGLGTEIWAIRELMNVGYSENDANLLVANWYVGITGEIPNGWKVLN